MQRNFFEVEARRFCLCFVGCLGFCLVFLGLFSRFLRARECCFG